MKEVKKKEYVGTAWWLYFVVDLWRPWIQIHWPDKIYIYATSRYPIIKGNWYRSNCGLVLELDETEYILDLNSIESLHQLAIALGAFDKQVWLEFSDNLWPRQILQWR